MVQVLGVGIVLTREQCRKTPLPSIPVPSPHFREKGCHFTISRSAFLFLKQCIEFLLSVRHCAGHRAGYFAYVFI